MAMMVFKMGGERSRVEGMSWLDGRDVVAM